MTEETKITELPVQEWKEVANLVLAVAEEATVRISDGKMLIREMDPSQIAMVSFERDINYHGEDKNFRINFNDLNKHLNGFNSTDVVSLSISDNKVLLKKGRHKISLSMLEISSNNLPRFPELKTTNTVPVLNVKNAVLVVKPCSSFIVIEAKDNEVNGLGKGDNADAEKDISEGPCFPARAMFPLDYLEKILPAGGEFHFGDSMPCRVEYELYKFGFEDKEKTKPKNTKYGKVFYFLAPRIESE